MDLWSRNSAASCEFIVDQQMSFNGRQRMLWTIAVILLVLWALGFLAFHVAGGLIHVLLVIALVVIVYQLVVGRRAV
jgi:hypothetical protein